MVPPLKKELVYQQIRQSIISGIYQPGMKLPRELDFAKQHKVSFITMRAALKRLESDGLIIRLRSKGTFVREPDERVQPAGTAEKRHILLMIPEYGGSPVKEDIFNRDLILGAVRQGYISNFEIEPLRADKNLARISGLCRDSRLAGVIWDRPSVDTHRIIRELKAAEVPQVLINRQLEDLPSVTCDYPTGIRQAVRYLRNIGHQYVMLIDFNPGLAAVFRERQETFREQLSFNGVENAGEYVVAGTGKPSHIPDGAAIAAAIRKHPEVTAVVVSNVAIELFDQYLKGSGIRVPEEMSVVQWGERIGFDRESPTPYSILTEPRCEVGSIAVEEIGLTISRKVRPAAPRLAIGELIVRRGCALPRNLKDTGITGKPIQMRFA